MSLRRPTPLRSAWMLVFAAAVALMPAGAAFAHNGTGGESSDYRIEITGWQGDHTGIRLRVVELGNRLELTRTSAASVTVLGYEGEPYLRLDASGVAENVNSPAHYLNLDRFASSTPPASASATATPSWTRLSDGTSVRWHDHRSHWMSTTPRADVLADPDEERVIFPANPIDLVLDGRPVSALVRVTWLPTPSKLVWFGAASILGLAIAAALVLRPTAVGGFARPEGFRARRGASKASGALVVPVLAVIGSVAALAGQGGSRIRPWLAGAAIAVAVLALIVRSGIVAVAACAIAGALATTRIEAFEHQLLAGWFSGPVQRVALVVALACCLGVVAAAIVGALEPSRPLAEDPT